MAFTEAYRKKYINDKIKKMILAKINPPRHILCPLPKM